MKKILTATIFVLINFLAFAQQKTITGIVWNNQQKPIVFANVALTNNADGKTIKGTVTDSSGNFLINISSIGTYKINITNIGYVNYTSNIINVDSSSTNIVLPNIILNNGTKINAAVIVTAKKKFIEIQADKTIMNIENSIAAIGNSAFELLKKAPAVTVDKDENIKLKGGIATIYIDGKPFYLSGEQLTQYLKNLQADAISKIEIIGNPTSKYDAAGLNGIINIRLKKNKAYGANGNASLGLGYGVYPKINTSTSFNYRNKSINIFSDASIGYNESFNKLTYNSIITNGTSTTLQDRNNYWHPKTNWNSFKVGADFSISKKTIIGILVKGSGDDMKAITDNETTFSNGVNQKLQSIITLKDDATKSNNYSYNINLKTELDSLGSEFVFDADYITYTRRAENTNYNNFKNAQNINYRNAYIFRNGTPADINIKTAKIDFTKVFNTSFKIETGAKYSTVQNDNFLKVDSLNASNIWEKDNNRTNTFLYTENIAAAYFNFTKDWKKISLQAGLRMENTYYKANSVTLNQVRDSNYTNLFPSVFLTYRLNEKNTFNASYSRRINRPSYQSLNPFIDFIDPYTQFEGNPSLKPSFTQSFEMKHSYNNFLYTTLSYSYTKAQSTNVILQDKNTGAVRNITANVGNSTYISLNENFSVEPTKWWSMDNSISFSGGKSTSTYPQYEFAQSFFGMDLNWENTFKLPKKFKIQLSAYYSAPYRDGIAKVRSFYGATIGLQKSLWNSKASIKLNYNNFIGLNAYRATYLSNNLNIKWINQWEGRRINLSFTYKFGNSNVKANRQRSSASEAEKNRVNL
jgi:Outer membrane protein beta-barrel family/Carboxypeptidase regulatory-like domain